MGVIIRTYKAAVTTVCRRSGVSDFAWQRNYYERTIRNQGELERIRKYILDNPTKWLSDP